MVVTQVNLMTSIRDPGRVLSSLLRLNDLGSASSRDKVIFLGRVLRFSGYLVIF